MAKRFHIGENGPGECGVDPSNPNSRGCPFGGESGDENHFDSMKEAQDAFEKKMGDEFGEFTSTQKNIDVSKLTKTEMNRLAKVSEDPEVLHSLSDTDSPRVINSLIKNPKTEGKTIDKIYREKGSDGSELNGILRKDLRINPSILSDKDFKISASSPIFIKAALKRDDLDDEALDRFETTEAGRRALNDKLFSQQFIYFRENNVSQERKDEILKNNEHIQAVLIASPETAADQIKGFLPDSVMGVSDLKSGKFLLELKDQDKIRAIYELHQKRKLGNSTYDRTELAILHNPNTPPDVVNEMSQREGIEKMIYLQEALVSNPHLSEEDRERISTMSKEAEAEYGIYKLTGKGSFELSNELREERLPTTPGHWRSTSIERYRLDKKKIEEYGLSPNDVKTIYRGWANMSVGYSEEDGVLHLRIDSSD